MTSLTLALAMWSSAPAAAPTSPSWFGGRVLTTDAVHVGVRPAFYLDNEADGHLEAAAGLTVQVSTFAL